MPKPLEILSDSFPEIQPQDYYRALFPAELLQSKGEYIQGKYNGIATQISEDGKIRRVQLTRELKKIEELIANPDFSMTAPVLFAGKNATIKNARWLTALIFDLDFLRLNKQGEIVGITDLLYQTSLSYEDPYNRLPKPTYLILSSERNLHVVYLLEKPIAMYRNVVEQVRNFRRAFIPKLWDSYITEAYKAPQFETSPVQAFRIVGSKSKDGNSTVRCFLTGEPLSLETLNNYVDEESRITTTAYYNELSLEKAKELYPDWYKRRIEQKVPCGGYQSHRGLYDWWKSKIPEIQVGHRYHYLLCMAAYAVKCGITEEELMRDIASARKKLDVISPLDNPLTMNDAAKAAQAYQERYRYLRRETISKLCGIEIKPAKRNGRTKAQHVTILNATNNAKRSLGEQIGGRQSRKDEVLRYFKQHPEAKVAQAAKELRLSRKTIYKWLKERRNG